MLFSFFSRESFQAQKQTWRAKWKVFNVETGGKHSNHSNLKIQYNKRTFYNLGTKLNDALRLKYSYVTILKQLYTTFANFGKGGRTVGWFHHAFDWKGWRFLSIIPIPKILMCVVSLVVPAMLWRRDARAGRLCGTSRWRCRPVLRLQSARTAAFQVKALRPLCGPLWVILLTADLTRARSRPCQQKWRSSTATQVQDSVQLRTTSSALQIVFSPRREAFSWHLLLSLPVGQVHLDVMPSYVSDSLVLIDAVICW